MRPHVSHHISSYCMATYRRAQPIIGELNLQVKIQLEECLGQLHDAFWIVEKVRFPLVPPEILRENKRTYDS